MAAGNIYRKFGEFFLFLRYASGQTNRQTDIADTLITTLVNK